jgi:hypothetical protein
MECPVVDAARRDAPSNPSFGSSVASLLCPALSDSPCPPLSSRFRQGLSFATPPAPAVKHRPATFVRLPRPAGQIGDPRWSPGEDRGVTGSGEPVSRHWPAMGLLQPREGATWRLYSGSGRRVRFVEIVAASSTGGMAGPVSRAEFFRPKSRSPCLVPLHRRLGVRSGHICWRRAAWASP